MRSSRRWAAILTAIGVGGLVAMAGRGRHTATAPGPPRQAPGLVYAVGSDNRYDVMWHAPGTQGSRSLYRSARSRWRPVVPHRFGFLPSPDGRRLLLWETETDQTTSLPEATRWLVLDPKTRATMMLGVTKGEGVLLPAWRGSSRLELMGAADTVSFDLGQEHHLQSLPTPISGQILGDRLLAYCARYYAKEAKWLGPVLDRLASRVAVGQDYEWFRVYPREYMLMRSVGVPALRELWHPHRRPYAAFSPDGAMLAYADTGQESAAGKEGMRQGTEGPLPGRLQVFAVQTGKLLWHLQVRSRAAPKKVPPLGPETLGRWGPAVPWTYAAVQDVRWSGDGRYLSFTLWEETGASVVVMDTTSWREVCRIPGAVNAFVVSSQDGNR